MAEQAYTYDKPLGLYGFESRQRLGETVVREFTRYEQVATEHMHTALFQGEDLEGVPHGFRLSSLVAEGSNSGYALAVTPNEAALRRGTEGVYYKIQFEPKPEVVSTQSIFVTHSSLLTNQHALEMDVKELTGRLDKEDLEAVMRMTGKLTAGLAALEAIQEKRQPQEMLYHRSAIETAAQIEPRVKLALQEYNLSHLAALYPAPSAYPAAPTQQENETQEPLHIAEWHDFRKAASSLFRRETDTSQSISTVALRHEIGNRTYYIKVAAAHGELLAAQTLCDNAGAWQTQIFDFDPERNEDAADLNIVSPMWDQSEIIESLQEGELIQDNIYESYRTMAAKCLQASFDKAVNLVLLRPQTKRPAA